MQPQCRRTMQALGRLLLCSMNGDARGWRQAHGAVQEDDDEYEAYRKRMQLGYKYRPNPLGNPRKQYY